jgi:hypothetical protein
MKLTNDDDRLPEDHEHARNTLEDRLGPAFGEIGPKIDQSLAELLFGYYPHLNQKEFIICRTVADTSWDLSGRILYDEVLTRVEDNLLGAFEDMREIEPILKGLIHNGILKLKTIYTWYGSREKWSLRPYKILKLRNDIESEVHDIISLQEKINK